MPHTALVLPLVVASCGQPQGSSVAEAPSWRPGELVQVREADPRFEWSPYWEYGAFIDGRDLARACVAALAARTSGCRCAFVASSHITTSGPTSRELTESLVPTAAWRGDRSFEERPFQTLVRIDRARELLGWEPVFTWRRFLAESTRGPSTRF